MLTQKATSLGEKLYTTVHRQSSIVLAIQPLLQDYRVRSSNVQRPESVDKGDSLKEGMLNAYFC